MIKDSLKNASTYYPMSDNLKIGFEWLINNNLDQLKDGKYCIKNEEVYASIQTYTTKDEAYYESHRKYIDIQYMINGKELVGVTDLNNCKTYIEYDKEKDLEFYTTDTEEEFYTLKSGDFLILFPHDAHKPSIKYNENSVVKKVVVKVAI